MYNLKHYESTDNPHKEDVINFILEYNDEFSKMEDSIVEYSNNYFIDEDEYIDGKDAIKIYYESLCQELIVILHNNQIVACRFVLHDEEDTYFKNNVNNYKDGLELTFALIDKKHRQKGLWTKMLNYVENNILPKYDLNRLYLTTAETNKAMKLTAEKANFELVSIIEGDRSNGQIDSHIYMKKYNM